MPPQPIDEGDDARAKQVDIESQAPRALIDGLFSRCEQVRQQRAESLRLQALCDKLVTRAVAAAPAAVREDDDTARAIRQALVGIEYGALERQPHRRHPT